MIDENRVFVLEVFDRTLWCPVLQSRVGPLNPELLRDILATQVDNDFNENRIYYLESDMFLRISRRLGIDFNAKDISQNREFRFRRIHKIRDAPYLVHTEYELFLLLEGEKKLAVMSDAYPPNRFEGEEFFDVWVKEGILYREEFLEPYSAQISYKEGLRSVYYTSFGEKWRIPAMRLIIRAAKSCGWNDYFERLEGMLYGYENWQIDWWMSHKHIK